MNANVGEFLAAREHARAVGDRSLEQAMNAELARLGHTEAPVAPVLETAAVEVPERRPVGKARPRQQPKRS